MSSQRIFIATVKGTYYANIDGRKTTLPYKEEFKLLDIDAALSVVKNTLLSDRLKSIYPHYVNFRTHELESIVSSDPDIQPDKGVLNLAIESMNASQLQDFCMLRKFSINPLKYPIEQARAMVLKANQDWMIAQKSQAEAQAEQKERDDLRALNDLPPEGEGGSDYADTPSTPSQEPAATTPPVNSEIEESGDHGPIPSAPARALGAPVTQDSSDSPLPPFVDDEPKKNIGDL